jgi:hypothetical protein
MNVRRVALLTLLAAGAACDRLPTEPAAVPAGPSMDGNGFTLGGGRSDPAPLPPGTSSQTAEATAGNGFTLGGG